MDPDLSKFTIDWVAIRDEIDLQAVIKEHGGVIRKGKFLCPAHNDTNPSASLLPKRKNQRWVCYSCGAGGSCIDYVMASMGISKNEAAVYLGRNYGVGLSENQKEEFSFARMLSKQILQALGLAQNPFFPAKEHVVIPPEKMGTEWAIESIPAGGYDKDMGALKLDEEEIKTMLRGKCMEYLASHTKNTTERNAIQHLLTMLAETKTVSRNNRDTDDYELGA